MPADSERNEMLASMEWSEIKCTKASGLCGWPAALISTPFHKSFQQLKTKEIKLRRQQKNNEME